MAHCDAQSPTGIHSGHSEGPRTQTNARPRALTGQDSKSRHGATTGTHGGATTRLSDAQASACRNASERSLLDILTLDRAQ